MVTFYIEKIHQAYFKRYGNATLTFNDVAAMFAQNAVCFRLYLKLHL